MTSEPRATLPKKGSIHRQWVRCGKPQCRCGRGERHAAQYLFWREGGRLRKRYIPAADAPAVRAACAARRQRERRAREALRAGWQQWRALVDVVREVESHG